MTNVYFDSPDSDQIRRERLYKGDLYVYGPTSATREFIALSRVLIEEAFAPLSPESAQFEMPVNQYAELLARFKPSFIHHPEAKRCIQNVLTDFGCDPDDTYFEVPKLRTSTSDHYLTAGIAYAWHPHRDTWYSAPQCQLNWWLPIYPVAHDNCMAFHTQYFDRPVENTSAGYNYHEWNVKYRGGHIAKYINEDPRPLPAPTAPVTLDPDVRIICPPGGVVIFSGAHLHSSVPNTSGKTRFSVDFRTASANDIRERRGAPNVDSACSGTVIREFRCLRDLSEVSDELAKLLSDGTESRGTASYTAKR